MEGVCVKDKLLSNSKCFKIYNNMLLLDFSLDISAMFNISYFHFYITINKNLTACVLGLAISSTFKYTDFEKKKT